MKAIVLSAGFGTRLYPLTKDTPKCLLEIGGQSIMEKILYDIEKIEEIDEVVWVSNAVFYEKFVKWSEEHKDLKKDIYLLNDFSTCNENRLGSIGDIKYALDFLMNKNGDLDDVMIMATDQFYTFDLQDYINFFKEKNADVILGSYSNDSSLLRRCMVAVLDENNKALNLEEKPENPKGNFVVIGWYIFKKESIKLLADYINEGNSLDAMGHFPEWLYTKKTVYAYEFNGECIDIGSIETYNEIREKYKKD